MNEPECEKCQKYISVCECPKPRDFVAKLLEDGQAGIVFVPAKYPQPKIRY